MGALLATKEEYVQPITQHRLTEGPNAMGDYRYQTCCISSAFCGQSVVPTTVVYTELSLVTANLQKMQGAKISGSYWRLALLLSLLFSIPWESSSEIGSWIFCSHLTLNGRPECQRKTYSQLQYTRLKSVG